MPEKTQAPTGTARNNLVELMIHAQRAGNIDEIEFGYESAGFDVSAPTGWMLFLGRFSDGVRRPRERRGDTLSISTRPNSPEPSAYVDGGYLRGQELLDWIDTPRPDWAGASRTGAEALRVERELMELAISNGWEVTYRITRAVMPGKLQVTETIAASLAIKAINWHYNDQTSPWSAEHDAPVSFQATLGRYLDEDSTPVSTGSWDYALVEGERCSAEQILKLFAGPPPWPQPVAAYDEDAERWVIPPALSVPRAWALDPLAHALGTTTQDKESPIP